MDSGAADFLLVSESVENHFRVIALMLLGVDLIGPSWCLYLVID